MSRRRGVGCIVAMLISLVAGATGTLGAQQIAVKAGLSVKPDTVRVGDPFIISVGIRAPRGATIEFPRVTDSASTVQSLDPVVVTTTSDTTATEQYAAYRVAAWDVGQQPIRLADAVVKVGSASRHVPLGGAIFVRSVLPQDTAQRVPKPLRPLFEINPFPWWIVALIAAAIIALLLLLWWWLRRRRRKPPVRVIVDPYGRAEAEFARIEALGLLEAGERGRYVTLMIEVLRDYLAARYAQAQLSLTSLELQRSMTGVSALPHERLTRVLTEADLIKFARRPVSGDRARELGAEARAIVAAEYEAAQRVLMPPVREAA